MKVHVHDYSGHPFQAELSRELSGRGHEVTHSWCAAHVSGRGHLAAEPGEALDFVPIAVGERIEKLSFVSRLVKELRYGVELARLISRRRPDVALISNVPIPMLVVLVSLLLLRRIPWVLWQQDVQGVAVRSFAGRQLSAAFRLVAVGIEAGERWAARKADAVVVISEPFLDVHRAWGTEDKVTVIPNWAPLDEIRPMPRDNAWTREHGLHDRLTLLYSGTLGLKHNPRLLVEVARRVIDAGRPAQLVVISEGPAIDLVRDEAARLDVPVTLLPFQPYERLPEVLASGDILMVLLEKEAGGFSVPSKTLSYLSAGRPILGLMPPENLAAQLVSRVDGCVLSPERSSLDPAARWAAEVLDDDEQRSLLGKKARELAEEEFALDRCADRFEDILALVGGGPLPRRDGTGVTVPRPRLAQLTTSFLRLG